MPNIIPDTTIQEQGVVPAQDVWPPAPGGGSSPQLWVQPGGAGTPIGASDPLAGVQSGVDNVASGEVSVCLGGSSNTASGGAIG